MVVYDHLMKNHYQTIAVTVVAISLFTMAAAAPWQPNDTAFRQKLAGTWLVDKVTASGVSLKGTIAYAANGSFIAKITVVTDSNKGDIQYEGTWTLNDGVLVETITKSDSKLAPQGTVTRRKLTQVDDHLMVYQTDKGVTESRARK